VADVLAHGQRLVSVVKMVTVLEDCNTKEQRFVVRFLWAKGLNAKDIHNEIVPVYGGKCLPCKAVHSWVKQFSQECSKVADDARPGAEVAETAAEKTSVLQVSTHW
jgi:hypothetical protein